MIASTLLILADTAVWQRGSRSRFAHYANMFCGNYCLSYCVSLGATQKNKAVPTTISTIRDRNELENIENVNGVRIKL